MMASGFPEQTTDFVPPGVYLHLVAVLWKRWKRAR